MMESSILSYFPRIPFGGTPCLSKFVLAADLMTDNIIYLLTNKNRDKESVNSNMIHEIPFDEARNISIEIPVEDFGEMHISVDDLCTIGLDTNDILERITRAPATVIYTIADNSYTL